MVQFFDGYRAAPHETRMELVNAQLRLYDTEAATANALVFSLKDCHMSIIGNRMFVYLDSGRSGAYLIVEENDDYYHELKHALSSSKKGWHERLFSQRWPVLAGIAALLLGIIYMVISWLLPFLVIQMISTKQETLLGEKIYASVVDTEKIDTASTRLAQEFADELNLSRTYTIHITVVKNKEINAFALPGGHIVVYTGILKALKSPDELVALLGHETTHVNRRHSLRGMLSKLSGSLLEAIVLNGFGSTGDFVLRNTNTLVSLRYSRGLEREADAGGMELMLRNRIDPEGMRELMLALKKINHDIPTAFSFISTHPLTEERIKNANAFIAQHKSATFATNEHLVHIWEQLKKR